MNENIYFIDGVAVSEEEFKAQVEKDCAIRDSFYNAASRISDFEKMHPTYFGFSKRESGKEYAEKLQDAYQNGKECECRSIVARLKNKFHDVGRGIIVYNEPVNGHYCVNLDDICNFILEDLDNA